MNIISEIQLNNSNFEIYRKIIEENDINEVKYLINNNNGDINHIYKFVQNALMYASGKGYIKYVKYLHKHGAYINCINNNGKNALMFASQEGHIECVKYLIDNGSNVNNANNNGWTALMMASIAGNIDCIKYLIKSGANVDHINNDGNTIFDIIYDQEIIKIIKTALSDI